MQFECLTRKDLQSLAKSSGVKANQSSADIIRELKAVAHRQKSSVDDKPTEVTVDVSSSIEVSLESFVKVGITVEILRDSEWIKATVLKVNKKSVKVLVCSTGDAILIKSDKLRSCCLDYNVVARPSELSCVGNDRWSTQHHSNVPSASKHTTPDLTFDEILDIPESSPKVIRHRRKSFKRTSSFEAAVADAKAEGATEMAIELPQDATIEVCPPVLTVVDIEGKTSNDDATAASMGSSDEIGMSKPAEQTAVTEMAIELPQDATIEVCPPVLTVVDIEGKTSNDDATAASMGSSDEIGMSKPAEQTGCGESIAEKVEVTEEISSSSGTMLQSTGKEVLPRMNNAQRLRMEAMQKKLGTIERHAAVLSSTPKAFGSLPSAALCGSAKTPGSANSRRLSSALPSKVTTKVSLSSAGRQSTMGRVECSTGKRKAFDDLPDKGTTKSAPDFQRLHKKQYSGLKSISECVDKVRR